MIWARCGQVIRHDICKLQHNVSFMTSCIVSNEIAKTPQKDEGKDDTINEIDEWKNLGNRSKVTKTDKWIIMKFGENSKEKYKDWSDIPDYVK